MLTVTSIADKLRPILEKHQVVLAYLFGSAARGEMGPHSDVDLGVVFEEALPSEEDFRRRLELSSDIASVLSVEDADVIDLQTVKDPLIKHNAVFTGQPILVKDPELRFAVERAIDRELSDSGMFNLMIGITIILDIGQHLLTRYKQRTAKEYKEVINLLGKEKIVPLEFAEVNIEMAKFRNLMVHDYDKIDEAMAYDYIQKVPDIFRKFSKYFIEFLDKHKNK